MSLPPNSPVERIQVRHRSASGQWLPSVWATPVGELGVFATYPIVDEPEPTVLGICVSHVPSGMVAGMCTPENVEEYVRQLEGAGGVKWRMVETFEDLHRVFTKKEHWFQCHARRMLAGPVRGFPRDSDLVTHDAKPENHQ